jgi:hypothetical protein
MQCPLKPDAHGGNGEQPYCESHTSNALRRGRFHLQPRIKLAAHETGNSLLGILENYISVEVVLNKGPNRGLIFLGSRA